MTFEVASSLTYCRAVVKEALRLRGPGPFLVLEPTEKYTTMSGKEVPTDASVFLLLRFAGTQETSFTRGKDFVPERWIDAECDAALSQEGGEQGKKSAVHTPEADQSFGHGARVCPGRELALLEAVMAVAAIIHAFNVELAPGQ
ncbi:unnamed protein product, partial [Choristocarpus tenellus]